MMRPSSNSKSISKQLRYLNHYQTQQIVVSPNKQLLCKYAGLVTTMGCFFVTWFLGTWPFSSLEAHAEKPSENLAGFRIFGPTIEDNTARRRFPASNRRQSFQQFTVTEQRDFLLEYGQVCQSWTTQDRNLLLERFDSFRMSPYLQIEIWKYCVLYVGVGNLYYDGNNVALMYDWSEVLDKIKNEKIISLALKIGATKDRTLGPELMHESLIYFSQPNSPVALKLIKVLVETPLNLLESQDMLPGLLAQVVEKDIADGLATWQLWSVICRDLAPAYTTADHVVGTPLRSKCSTPGIYCCQVTFDQHGHDNLPVLALRHPGRVNNPFKSGNPPLPYDSPEPRHMNQEVVRFDNMVDVPFISTVRLVDLNVAPATELETPNFFDILLQNDCLPTQKECHHCLQHRGHCAACQDECPCYCKVLCRIRPPPKRVVQEFLVRLPMYRRDQSRLVPRIVHQTWYESVTPTKYPNMSRLIQSWSTSGWEYRFYDDTTAAEFISQHFPPHVREAYDALVPGAFKADLFRYCVLLIYGGVYADMDVLLESNLDHAVAPDVGFMTPIDEPGSDVGHRSCLWNGLLAVAPGHPVMAKVVELVVNHIRNRFTSVDYDDMLCPNPVLSVSHTVDTLFTCGPCILGAALNILMKRHPQTEFKVGTLDVWGAEEESQATTATRGFGDLEYDGSDDDTADEEDPRWLFPGRTIILHQNKQDMGAHRFTWLEQNMVVASTDFPDYDDRSSTVEHYSKAHEHVGVYGLHRLYRDQHSRVNEDIRIRVLRP